MDIENMSNRNNELAAVRRELCKIIKTAPTISKMAGKLSEKIGLSDSLIDDQYDMLEDESDLLTACLVYREASDQDCNEAANELVQLSKKYLDKYGDQA